MVYHDILVLFSVGWVTILVWVLMIITMTFKKATEKYENPTKEIDDNDKAHHIHVYKTPKKKNIVQNTITNNK